MMAVIGLIVLVGILYLMANHTGFVGWLILWIGGIVAIYHMSLVGQITIQHWLGLLRNGVTLDQVLPIVSFGWTVLCIGIGQYIAGAGRRRTAMLAQKQAEAEWDAQVELISQGMERAANRVRGR